MATAVSFLVFAPLSSQGSGAAVGRPAVSSSAGASGDLERAVSERCFQNRRGIAYYRVVVDLWRDKKGAPPRPQTAERPGSCARARYLAHRWRARARTARLSFEAWLEERGRTITRLDRGLAGSPMAGLGIVFEKHGRRHGVSPYFMAAIAATESSLGRRPCSSNRRNVWGLASCVNSWHVPYFDTWDEAIAFFARFLSGRWPSADTAHEFYGYAACSGCWGRKTAYWMSSLFHVGPEVRYP